MKRRSVGGWCCEHVLTVEPSSLFCFLFWPDYIRHEMWMSTFPWKWRVRGHRIMDPPPWLASVIKILSAEEQSHLGSAKWRPSWGRKTLEQMTQRRLPCELQSDVKNRWSPNYHRYVTDETWAIQRDWHGTHDFSPGFILWAALFTPFDTFFLAWLPRFALAIFKVLTRACSAWICFRPLFYFHVCHSAISQLFSWRKLNFAPRSISWILRKKLSKYLHNF